MEITKTPLLLIGFNRPELLTRVIDRLRDVEPRQVFLAVDGPRESVHADHDRVQRTRECVDLLDWDCEVQTLFREENLGCGRAVSGAIDWFFSKVEAGVILEDDIIPDLSFFPYASELLRRFRDDQRVFAISGSSYLPPAVAPQNHSYRFSMFPNIWGWATWRDRWAQYEFGIGHWRKDISTRRLWQLTNHSPWAFAFWSTHFDLMARHRIDTWDLQLVATAMRTGGLTVTPNTNLIENIGWGADSTHTQTVPHHVQPSGSIALPLIHAPVNWDASSDAWTNTHAYDASPSGALRKMKRMTGDRLHWRMRRDGE